MAINLPSKILDRLLVAFSPQALQNPRISIDGIIFQDAVDHVLDLICQDTFYRFR